MVKQITLKELLDLFQSGERFTLVDVLGVESYIKEHIRTAISIPLDEIGRRTKSILGRDEKIVTYCASFDCKASTMAAEKLVKLGFKHVLDFKGGLAEYKKAGLPLDRGSIAGACVGADCTCCN